MTGADRVTDGEVDLMRDHPVHVEIIYVLLVRGGKAAKGRKIKHDKVAIEIHPLITASYTGAEILGELDFAKPACAVRGGVIQYRLIIVGSKDGSAFSAERERVRNAI